MPKFGLFSSKLRIDNSNLKSGLQESVQSARSLKSNMDLASASNTRYSLAAGSAGVASKGLAGGSALASVAMAPMTGIASAVGGAFKGLANAAKNAFSTFRTSRDATVAAEGAMKRYEAAALASTKATKGLGASQEAQAKQANFASAMARNNAGEISKIRAVWEIFRGAPTNLQVMGQEWTKNNKIIGGTFATMRGGLTVAKGLFGGLQKVGSVAGNLGLGLMNAGKSMSFLSERGSGVGKFVGGLTGSLMQGYGLIGGIAGRLVQGIGFVGSKVAGGARYLTDFGRAAVGVVTGGKGITGAISNVATVATLGANKLAGPFVNALKSSASAGMNLITTLAGIGAKLVLVGGAIAVAGGAMIIGGFKSIDALAKTADSFDMPIQKLRELRFAGKLVGASNEEIDGGIKHFIQTINSVDPDNPYVQALNNAGISVDKLRDIPVDKALDAMQAALGTIGNEATKAKVAVAAFGVDNARLFDVLNMGDEKLRNSANSVKKFGGDLTNVDASKVQMAMGVFSQFWGKTQLLTELIAVKLAPIVEMAANKLFNMGADGASSMGIVEKAIGFVIEAVAKTIEVAQFLTIKWMETKSAAASLASEIITKFADMSDSGNSFNQVLVQTVAAFRLIKEGALYAKAALLQAEAAAAKLSGDDGRLAAVQQEQARNVSELLLMKMNNKMNENKGLDPEEVEKLRDMANKAKEIAAETDEEIRKTKQQNWAQDFRDYVANARKEADARAKEFDKRKSRGTVKADAELQGKTPDRSPLKALEQGSKEAYQAIFEARQQGKKDDIPQKQLDEATRTREVLEEQLRLQKAAVEGVAFPA